MKIFYDFYEIAFDKGKSIGIYNYAISLLNALALNYEDVEFVVACSDEHKFDLPVNYNVYFKIVSPKYPTLKQRILWRYHEAIKTAESVNADIYFTPKGFSPGIAKRTSKPFIVVTIHDMIPFYYLEKHPDYFGFFQNLVITRTLLQSISIANGIITVSNFSKEKILKYYKKDADINVVYNGVSVLENKVSADNRAPYIFAITSNLPHKNKDNLINGYLAYARKTTNPLPLKVCGINKNDVDIDIGSDINISFIKYANPNEFKDLFSNATAFVFVPEIEGFGFPPLEALLYNIPSVVSDIPVLREVLAESAVFVDPYDTENIGQGIQTLLADQAIYHRIINGKDDTISKYTWEKCAHQTMDVFKRLTSGSK